jgi:hypothetical protein
VTVDARLILKTSERIMGKEELTLVFQQILQKNEIKARKGIN